MDNGAARRLTLREVSSLRAISITFAPLVLITTTAGYADAAALSQLEDLCARGIASAAARLATLWTRADTQCRIAVAAGDATGPCPGASAETAIEPVLRRLERRVHTFCQSACSVTQSLPCITDDQCPPLPHFDAAESCTAGVSDRPFDMRNIGFPGPFCAEALGRPVDTSDDIAACVDTLTRQAASELATAMAGDLPPLSLSGSALVCQRRIVRRTRRLAAISQRILTRCRNAILSGSSARSPSECATKDPSFVTRVGVLTSKLAATVENSCSEADIAALDLCGAGVGGITTREAAADCLEGAAREIVDTTAAPDARAFSRITLIEASYPPSPVCGDSRVNQIANPFLPLGEECDGSDDSACPGECLPPGDTFECSCGDRRRQRLFTLSAATDLDQGWTGAAMNTTVPDGSGFTVELTSCDCSEMDGATCVGTSLDPVCTVTGLHKPRCSWEYPVGPRCDARGNGNGADEHRDCWVCDQYAANAGASCNDESDCSPLCYDEGGIPGAACPTGQASCPAGQVCRGRCDREPTCIALPLAAPSPVASGGAPICIVQLPRDDLIGTTNIVTGEHAYTQRTRVRIYSSQLQNVPCPVCGGVCKGGPFEGSICEGTCSETGASCRLDNDCPGGEFCTAESDRCPEGICDLGLFCRGGANDGLACRIEAETSAFGTVSSDCPPALGNNITGNGLIVDYAPATSETSAIATSVPCTGPGYELFDCPCPDDGGRRTQPNRCRPACNAGAEFGIGCADGGGSAGRFTTCAGGIHAGRACDEASDCPGSSCSNNPRHCIGDAAFEHSLCTSNGDCGLGTCLDACPSGKCVPLCLPSAADTEEGVCAAGPAVYHCSGPLDSFRACGVAEAQGGCAAVCEIALTACDSRDDCPPGEACIGPCDRARSCEAGTDGILGNVDDLIGAGACVEDVTICNLDPVGAEGGDTINGRGGPSAPLSVAAFCLGRTSSPSVDTVVGVGGPGRLRKGGMYTTNGFATLP